MKSNKAVQDHKERQANIEKKKKRKAFCHRISVVYNPIAVLSFVATYWVIGLKNAEYV